jgi:O-antigen/teichoic acid export membrane protein
MITPLITAPYTARVLGADGIGRYSYMESIASYFVLAASLGIATHGQREISYVSDSLEKRSEVFWNIKLLQCTTSLAALLGYIIYALQTGNPNTLLFALNIVNVLFDITWFFYGVEEFGKVVFRNIVLQFIGIIYLFLFVKDRGDLSAYIFGRTAFAVLGSISLWGYLPKYLCKIKLKQLRPWKDFKVVIVLFIPCIATQIYTVLDKTMLGIITGDAFENGYYEQAMKITKMLVAITTSLGTVLFPRVGNYYATGEKEKIYNLIYKGYHFIWFIGCPIVFGVNAVADLFVPFFYGAGYDKVAVLMQVLSLLVIVIGLSNVTGIQYMLPTRQEKQYNISVIVGAAVNFCLNMFMIPAYGSLGASISSVAAEVSVTLAMLVFVRKKIDISQIVKTGYKNIIASAVMFLVLQFVKTQLTFSNIINMIILIVLGAGIYLLGMCLLRDEMVYYCLDFVKSKVHRKNNNN